MRKFVKFNTVGSNPTAFERKGRYGWVAKAIVLKSMEFSLKGSIPFNAFNKERYKKEKDIKEKKSLEY